MKVWGITPEQARECASEVGLAIHSDWNGSGITQIGRALSFRLALGEDKSHYRKVGRGGRRIAAVCWHGHRDFMRAVFAVNPEARIKSAVADYRGSEHFEQTFPATGRANVGSLFEPLVMQDACECGHEVAFSKLTLEDKGLVQSAVRQIRQSSLMACPHVIFDPDHYRADGTCRCNDPAEQARLIRDFDYEVSDFPEGVLA